MVCGERHSSLAAALMVPYRATAWIARSSGHVGRSLRHRGWERSRAGLGAVGKNSNDGSQLPTVILQFQSKAVPSWRDRLAAAGLDCPVPAIPASCSSETVVRII